MLKRLSQRELLEQVAADWSPQIRAAWVEAINAITSRIVLRRIVEKLERGDVAGVVRDLGIEEGVFARFENALVQAYNSGGLATVDSMPALRDPAGNRIVFSWGVRNLPAEQAMRDHAARLVTGIVTEARDGIAAVLTENLARGQSPYDAGRMIAGRLNRANGVREGGLVGLSRPQMETVARIQRAMREGDTAYMRDYLTFANRDKRLDRTVLKAIREGRGLAPEEAERVTRLYANKALKYRGDTISILETNTALAMAKRDAFQQQIDEGKLEAGDVTKTWGRSISRNRREMHSAMVGVTVPFDQPFTLPDGIQCTGPHDPALPASHRVNCKCPMPEYRIDFTGQALRRYRERTGG
ncbi:head morphogenesis protein [Aquamicrobium segne]|uniref:Head morphogenesis protein n=1 Tax=Aquamicrobium segne TaxID=469547 RepID=A0ABW0GZK6_9HYPH